MNTIAYIQSGTLAVASSAASLTTARQTECHIMAEGMLPERVTVYKITHVKSGMSYVGLTGQSPADRWAQHRYDARRSRSRRSALHNAIRKYGSSEFVFEVLREAASLQAACAEERKLIAEFRTMRPHGFNLTGGGEMTPGIEHSGELRERNKARWHDPEFRERTLAGLRRNVRWSGPDAERHRTEMARRLAERNRRNWQDPEYAAGMIATMQAREVSQETRRKISKAGRGRPGRHYTDEERAAYSARVKAHYAANPKAPESADTRKRKSDAAKDYWERRRAARAAGEIERVGHKPHRNSEEAKRKIAQAVSKIWAARKAARSGEG